MLIWRWSNAMVVRFLVVLLSRKWAGKRNNCCVFLHCKRLEWEPSHTDNVNSINQSGQRCPISVCEIICLVEETGSMSKMNMVKRFFEPRNKYTLTCVSWSQCCLNKQLGINCWLPDILSKGIFYQFGLGWKDVWFTSLPPAGIEGPKLESSRCW